jgi:hypothetical protein
VQHPRLRIWRGAGAAATLICAGLPAAGDGKMKYRVHRFDLKMTQDQTRLEEFLNSLTGEVIAIVPNVTARPYWVHGVDFLLIVEKLR